MTSPAENKPFELFLQFSRSEFGDNAYVIPEESLEYQRTDLDGGKVSTASLPWNRATIKNGLAALQTEDAKSASILTTLGGELQRFLRACRVDGLLEKAYAAKQPIRLTIRSAAAELYALPWELTRLEDNDLALAQIPDCTIRYTWPTAANRAVVNAAPRPEGGRILYAWSPGNGSSVPWKEHLEALEAARDAIGGDEKQRRELFDRERDMVAHASFQAIRSKLEHAALQEKRPYDILHLLCHGGDLEDGEGIGLVFTTDNDRKKGFSADGRQTNDVTNLRKQTVPPNEISTLFEEIRDQKPILVVVCACLGSAPVKPGSHLGSVALAFHRQGIESVIASRFLLSKAGSILLCAELYGSLLGTINKTPLSLEAAVSAARKRLRRDRPHIPDYAALQLFQNTTGWDTRPVVFRPYRGLLTFGLEHQRYFFGRDVEVKETVDDLGNLIQGSADEIGHPRPRFLIVAAASGTGKSSMV
ncbi:MAG TPA: CHAT domain-containing protein, partial [Polyangium sp.]|nr:CHAT domain-containing protein [Polyangium sp.]